VAYLVLAAVALGNAGCLVAAAAGAGAGVAGYAYYKGKVCRTYLANVEDVRAAMRTALVELGMPVLKDEVVGQGAKIESHAGNDSIEIALELQDGALPGEGSATQVGVRVATFGDGKLSERILDQIGAHLVPAGVPAAQPAATQPPAAPAPLTQTAAPPLAK
jgi:hypothetical protein